MQLELLPGRFAVCRLAADRPVPPPTPGAALWSVTRTGDELSLVVPEEAARRLAPADAVEGPFAALRVAGTLDFALTGILASLAAPLAAAGVPIFALSTYDTDYLLVPAGRLERARAALEASGHRVIGSA